MEPLFTFSQLFPKYLLQLFFFIFSHSDASQVHALHLVVLSLLIYYGYLPSTNAHTYLFFYDIVCFLRVQVL